MARKRSQPFQLGETSVAPGTQERVLLPAARLYSDTPLDLHVEVLHGTKPGPVLLVCAAIHGDELNGIEICRRLIQLVDPRELSGTLLIVPVVNMFGFIQQTRYLPDRRDLNRCFSRFRARCLGQSPSVFYFAPNWWSARPILSISTPARFTAVTCRRFE